MIKFISYSPLFFAGLLALPAVTGCTPRAQDSAHDYHTVAKDLRRDTEKAKRQDAQAVALIKAGKYKDACEVLKDALSADVTFGPAHNNLGVAYYHLSELYPAAWEFQYAAKLMPDQPEPRNNLGMVLESAGKLNEAVSAYDEAIQMRPDNPQFVGNDARARFQRGDRDQKERELLERLATIDQRPEWSNWAREKLVLMAPSTQP